MNVKINFNSQFKTLYLLSILDWKLIQKISLLLTYNCLVQTQKLYNRISLFLSTNSYVMYPIQNYKFNDFTTRAIIMKNITPIFVMQMSLIIQTILPCNCSSEAGLIYMALLLKI